MYQFLRTKRVYVKQHHFNLILNHLRKSSQFVVNYTLLCRFARFSLRFLISANRFASLRFARAKNLWYSFEGLNDFSKSIGSNRYRPSIVRTRDRTTYSQFLNNADRPP